MCPIRLPTTAAELKEMLEKHKFVYLKPTGGSLGIGIYRLTYARTGIFCKIPQRQQKCATSVQQIQRLDEAVQKINPYSTSMWRSRHPAG